ncbi:hypothetical protein C7999DRAFT_33892 [Corynascus novoguineensis]|uniref:Uncharacterized protein n=1 Tax=Corynascus novoguineensis TaxID=1126955 RepID=A0AAN7HN62_9PEZI|nr:hypothetical protein C7999DRAFT_33892 [Corynascus novoguineensis]
MMCVPTTTKVWSANAGTPTPWGHQYAAMTDYLEGYVLIWKLEERGERADGLVKYWDAKTVVKAVARADVAEEVAVRVLSGIVDGLSGQI